MYKRLTISSLSATERVALRNARLRSGQCIRCFQSSHISQAGEGNDDGSPYNAPKKGSSRQQRAALISEEVRQVQRGQPIIPSPGTTDPGPSDQQKTIYPEALGETDRPGAMGENAGPTREGPAAQGVGRTNRRDEKLAGGTTSQARATEVPSGKPTEPSEGEESIISDRFEEMGGDDIESDEAFALPQLPTGYSWLRLTDPVAEQALPQNSDGMLESPVEGAEIVMAIHDHGSGDVLVALAQQVPATTAEEADIEYVIYNVRSKEYIREGPLLEAVAEAVDLAEGAQDEIQQQAFLDSLRNEDGSLSPAPLPAGYEWMSAQDIVEAGLPYNEAEDIIPSPVKGAESRGYVRATQGDDVFVVLLTPDELIQGQDEPEGAEISLYNMRNKELVEEGELVEAVGAAVQAYTDAAEEASYLAEAENNEETPGDLPHPVVQDIEEGTDESQSLEVDVALPNQYSWLTEEQVSKARLPRLDDPTLSELMGSWEPFDYARHDKSGHDFLVLCHEREVGDEFSVQVRAYNWTLKNFVEDGELVKSVAEQLTKQINQEANALDVEGKDEQQDLEKGGEEMADSPIEAQEELVLLDQLNKRTVGDVDYRPEAADKTSLLQLGQNGSSIASGNFEGVVEDRLRVAAEPAADGFRHPPYLAEKIMSGQYVRFQSQEEQEATAAAAKNIAERRANNISKQRGGEQLEPRNYELSSMPESVRKAMVDKMVAGKYDANGLLNQSKSLYPKQPVLDSIAKMTTQNSTYLSEDGQRFLKKVQSLLPAMQQQQQQQPPPKKGGKK